MSGLTKAGLAALVAVAWFWVIFDLPYAPFVAALIATVILIFKVHGDVVGECFVMNDEDRKIFSLSLDVDPQKMEHMSTFTFKVRRPMVIQQEKHGL